MGLGKDRYEVRPHGQFHMVYDTQNSKMIKGDLTLNDAKKEKNRLDTRHRKNDD